jgi:hypothetical protein
MARWKLTIRHGSQVDHDRLDSLDDALGALRTRVEALAGAPSRETVKVFSREFEPVAQVAGRGELSGPKGARGGIDIRGDGSTEAWVGRWRRTVLTLDTDETPYDALRRELCDPPRC